MRHLIIKTLMLAAVAIPIAPALAYAQDVGQSHQNEQIAKKKYYKNDGRHRYYRHHRGYYRNRYPHPYYYNRGYNRGYYNSSPYYYRDGYYYDEPQSGVYLRFRL